MTPNCKQQFPAGILKRLRPVLGSEKSEIELHYYRFFANSVWYDAARANKKGDNFFAFLEIIFTTENNESKIAGFTFKGAMR